MSCKKAILDWQFEGILRVLTIQIYNSSELYSKNVLIENVTQFAWRVISHFSHHRLSSTNFHEWR